MTPFGGQASFIARLRSGNPAAGRGVIAFLREALALLPQGWRRIDGDHEAAFLPVIRLGNACRRRPTVSAL